ncbi:hypothetical protein POM88_005972 [Heracleum sosnowskyi]|uniref:Uncharacterized protein n=1 Tax=Heracleum sosnowskyi TaxID=360622 RepID=A0AAD8N4C4_9APIA|nr:hypothetical protein POM88_005972 [Heracleum sosnowskyi]
MAGVAGQGPARRRGRPPIVVTEEVLERRRLSRQRIRAQALEGVDGQGPAPKRGRPPVVVTAKVLDRWRLSRQRVNAQRPKSEAVAHARESGGAAHGAAIANNLQSPPAKESECRGESQRMRRSIDGKKKEFMESNVVLSLGKQDQTCEFCTAQVWSAEFTGRHVGAGPKGYTICCGKGKVQLPLLREPPLLSWAALSLLLRSAP